MLASIALLALAASAHAFSNGEVTLCNALSPLFGCKQFKSGSRACTESDKIMDWVAATKSAPELFELFVGPEDNKQTTYTPGEWLTVSLRSKKYGQQYRGLLLYAVDGADKSSDPAKIGEWAYTDREPMFHGFCNPEGDVKKSVVHASGELKPYLTSWQFKVPADFTGELRFPSLLKVGPANVGEFYWANDLRLTKASGASVRSKAERWHVGQVGQSCSDVCAAVDSTLLCDESRLSAANSAPKVAELILPYVPCVKPALARCDAIGLSTGDEGFCYYRNNAQCTAADQDVGSAVSCDAKLSAASVGQRICPCKVDPSKTTAMPKPTTAPGNGGASNSNSNGGSSGSNCTPGAEACVCKEDGSCDGGDCKLQESSNQGVCVKPLPKCLYGEVGCPCDFAASDCGSALECKKAADGNASGFDGVCVRKGDECQDGDLGCFCTAAGGCNDLEYVCAESPGEPRPYCTFGAQSGDVCLPATKGCPCDLGRCDPGLECQVIVGEEHARCNIAQVDEDDDSVGGGARALLSAGAVALLALAH